MGNCGSSSDSASKNKSNLLLLEKQHAFKAKLLEAIIQGNVSQVKDSLVKILRKHPNFIASSSSSSEHGSLLLFNSSPVINIVNEDQNNINNKDQHLAATPSAKPVVDENKVIDNNNNNNTIGSTPQQLQQQQQAQEIPNKPYNKTYATSTEQEDFDLDLDLIEKFHNTVTGATILHYACASPEASKITALIFDHLQVLSVLEKNRTKHLQESDYVNRTETFKRNFLPFLSTKNQQQQKQRNNSSSSSPSTFCRTIRELVQKTTNEKDGRFSPLHVAIQAHAVGAVKLLLSASANVNQCTGSSSTKSVTSSSSSSYHPLHFACVIPNQYQKEAMEIVGLLLDRKAELFSSSSSKSNSSTASSLSLLSTIDGNNCLHFAALAGNSLVVRRILHEISGRSAGASSSHHQQQKSNNNTNNPNFPRKNIIVNTPNLKNETPLLCACRSGAKLAVESLLEAGANPEIFSIAPFLAPAAKMNNHHQTQIHQIQKTQKMMTFWSPLSAAIFSGNFELVQLLLHHLRVRPLLPVHLAQKYRSLKHFALTLLQNHQLINNNNNNRSRNATKKTQQQNDDHADDDEFLNIFDDNNNHNKENKKLEVKILQQQIEFILPDKPLQHKLIYKNLEIVATGREIAFFDTNEISRISLTKVGNDENDNNDEKKDDENEDVEQDLLVEVDSSEEGDAFFDERDEDREQQQQADGHHYHQLQKDDKNHSKPGHTYRVLCCAFSPAASRTSSSYDHLLNAEDISSSTPLLLATGSADKSICIWDLKTGELRTLIKNAHASAVRALSFLPSSSSSPSSSTLLHPDYYSCLYSASQSLRVWNALTGKELCDPISSSSRKMRQNSSTIIFENQKDEMPSMQQEQQETDDHQDSSSSTNHADKIISMSTTITMTQSGSNNNNNSSSMATTMILLATGSFQEIFLWEISKIESKVKVNEKDYSHQEEGDEYHPTSPSNQRRTVNDDNDYDETSSSIDDTSGDDDDYNEQQHQEQDFYEASPSPFSRHNHHHHRQEGEQTHQQQQYFSQRAASLEGGNTKKYSKSSKTTPIITMMIKVSPKPILLMKIQQPEFGWVKELKFSPSSSLLSSSSNVVNNNLNNNSNNNNTPLLFSVSEGDQTLRAWNIDFLLSRLDGLVGDAFDENDDEDKIMRNSNNNQEFIARKFIMSSETSHQNNNNNNCIISSIDTVCSASGVICNLGLSDGSIRSLDGYTLQDVAPAITVAVVAAAAAAVNSSSNKKPVIVGSSSPPPSTSKSIVPQQQQHAGDAFHEDSKQNINNNKQKQQQHQRPVLSCACPSHPFITATASIVEDETSSSSSSSSSTSSSTSVIQLWDSRVGKPLGFAYSSSSKSSRTATTTNEKKHNRNNNNNKHKRYIRHPQISNTTTTTTTVTAGTHHHDSTMKLKLPSGIVVLTMKFCSIVDDANVVTGSSTTIQANDDDDGNNDNTDSDDTLYLVCGLSDGDVHIFSMSLTGRPIRKPLQTECYVTDLMLILPKEHAEEKNNNSNQNRRRKTGGTDIILQYSDMAGRFNRLKLTL